jgi:fructokinase
VGDDALGQQVLAAMQAWGMDCSGMQVDHAHATGVVEVTLDQGEPRYHIVESQAYDFIAVEQLPRIRGDSLLYHGSLASRSAASAGALTELKRLLRGKVFVDINLRAPWWDRQQALQMLADARWIKLNAEELATLLPLVVDEEARIAALLHDALDYAVVTRGDRGASAIVARGRQRHELRPGATSVIDAVGAGDAFCSVLILGEMRQWPLPLTLQRAQQFASAIVGMRGATPRDMRFYHPYNVDWT